MTLYLIQQVFPVLNLAENIPKALTFSSIALGLFNVCITPLFCVYVFKTDNQLVRALAVGIFQIISYASVSLNYSVIQTTVQKFRVDPIFKCYHILH